MSKKNIVIALNFSGMERYSSTAIAFNAATENDYPVEVTGPLE